MGDYKITPILRASMDERDPFEPEAVLLVGPYTGHRLDTARFRSIQLLPAAEAAKFGANQPDRIVANFRHQGNWHLARIPTDPVAEVIVHIERVPHSFPGAHAQIRFKLLEGRELSLFAQPSPEARND